MTAIETITACENVCRDFSWMAPLAPAFITAGAALLIAFGAYPWQKKRDRDLKIAEEKRLAYQHFFEAAETFFARLRTAAFNERASLPDNEFGRLEAAKAELAFRCGEDAVAACADFAQHLKDYRKYVKLCRQAKGGPSQATLASRNEAYHKANAARVSAILMARSDAGTIGANSASEETVRKLFMMATNEDKS